MLARLGSVWEPEVVDGTFEVVESPGSVHHSVLSKSAVRVLLSSQFWLMPSMPKMIINCAKLFLTQAFSRVKTFD